MVMNRSEIGTRIKSLLSEQPKGKRQTWLAKSIGMPEGALSELLNDKGTRRWNTDKLSAVANALGVPISFLLDKNQTSMLPKVVNLKPIMVIGSVQAGVFRDALEWPEDDRYAVVVPIESPEVAARCFGLVVDGPSMNKVYPDGVIVIVCPLSYYQAPLRTNDRVLVKRIRGDVVEATIKELEIKDGRAHLWPRSTDPRYQSPVDINWPYVSAQKAALDSVEICGIVVSSISIEKRI